MANECVFKNPPITAVMCQLRFKQNSKWDMTTGGLFSEKVKGDSFKYKNNVTVPVGALFSTNNDSWKHDLTAYSLFRFMSENEKITILLGDHMIIVFGEIPYNNWNDSMKKYINIAYEGIKNVIKDIDISNVALEYADKIGVDPKDNNIKKLMNFRPQFDKLGLDIKATTSDIIVEDAGNLLKLKLFMDTNAKSGKIDYIINTQYHSNSNMLENSDDFDKWLEKAHDKIKSVFFDSITEKMVMIIKNERSKNDGNNSK